MAVDPGWSTRGLGPGARPDRGVSNRWILLTELSHGFYLHRCKSPQPLQTGKWESLRHIPHSVVPDSRKCTSKTRLHVYCVDGRNPHHTAGGLVRSRSTEDDLSTPGYFPLRSGGSRTESLFGGSVDRGGGREGTFDLNFSSSRSLSGEDPTKVLNSVRDKFHILQEFDCPNPLILTYVRS